MGLKDIFLKNQNEFKRKTDGMFTLWLFYVFVDSSHYSAPCSTSLNAFANYAALKEGENVVFELQKTFWGSSHAVLTDRFGIAWQLDYSGR